LQRQGLDMPGTGAELDSISNCENKDLKNIENSKGTDKGTDSAFSTEKAVCIDENLDPDDRLKEPTQPTPDNTRLAVLADLLADLPETERQILIADLPTADRVTIARILIERQRD